MKILSFIRNKRTFEIYFTFRMQTFYLPVKTHVTHFTQLYSSFQAFVSFSCWIVINTIVYYSNVTKYLFNSLDDVINLVSYVIIN